MQRVRTLQKNVEDFYVGILVQRRFVPMGSLLDVPMDRKVIIKTRRHFCAIINGVINDTFIPTFENISGYWEYTI
jgi:hypothetical protein